MSRKMTNAEAIANLNHIYGMVSPNIQRSLDVAFKAMERATGKWIGDTDYESYQGYYEAYKCSSCGYGLHWRDYCTNEYNFCPACGADMRGEENGNQN